MRDLLIRYLLGELDADEQQKLQSQLCASPELRQELAKLRACYEAHRNDELDTVPPSGLASRIIARITNCDDASELVATRRRDVFSTGGDPPPGILGWSLADLTVAGGVILAVSMLIFPALRTSRDGFRREVCGNNLKEIWLATVSYAENNGNYFPKIGPREHAGAFVIQLIAKGYADPKDIAKWLVCPDSPLAEKMRTEGLEFRVPSAEDMKTMSASELDALATIISPCFAYSLPHRVGHELRYVRNDHSRFTPVLSDTPGKLAANSMTPNHGGCVAQIQFADGSRKSFTCWKQPSNDDDLSRNNMGLVAAGIGANDAVMGGSDATPGADPAADGE